MFSMLLVMSTKKIQYNPNILSSLKTKTKTQKINRPLLINQNSLKNQLISRIKNHKQNEQKEIKDIIEIKEVKNKSNEIKHPSFADEFNDSINYLSQLSKKHKTVEQNLNKTIRQKHDLIDSNQVYVDVELPQELKEFMPLKAVVHCFSGDESFLKRCLEMGFLISFTCNITYKKAENLRDALRVTPMGKLLLETDAPYLSPEGFRGRRNEPYQVRLLAEEIARLKKLSFEEVATVTTHNAKNFFNLE